MKNLLFILFTVVVSTANAQIPDTIYYVPFTYTGEESIGTSDSGLYIVYESKTLPTSSISYPYPIDNPMTADQVAEYVFNILYSNENLNWLDEARVNSRNKVSRLNPSINAILTNLKGQNYFQYARTKLGKDYEGVYRVVVLPTRAIEYFLVRSNGTVVQCDETGSVITGGKSGNMQILTENRFRLLNYFTEPVIFNRELETSFYYSDAARIKKLNINLSTN